MNAYRVFVVKESKVTITKLWRHHVESCDFLARFFVGDVGADELRISLCSDLIAHPLEGFAVVGEGDFSLSHRDNPGLSADGISIRQHSTRVNNNDI